MASKWLGWDLNPGFQTQSPMSIYKAKRVQKEVEGRSQDYPNVTNLWAYGILGNISGNAALKCFIMGMAFDSLEEGRQG